MTSELYHRLLVAELQALLSVATKQGFVFRLSDSHVSSLDDDTLQEWRDEVRAYLKLVGRARENPVGLPSLTRDGLRVIRNGG